MSNLQNGSGTTLMNAPAAVGGGSVNDGNDLSIDPCSNDNPEFEKETLPCQGSVADGIIFEGAIEPTTTLPTLPKFDVSKFNLETPTTTTVAPKLNTAQMDNNITTTTIADSELPSFFSCTATSEDELTGRNDNNILLLSFKYEIYTASTFEDFSTLLSTLERRLTNGVASSLGLDKSDCPEGGDGLAVEVSVRSAEEGGRQLLPLRGMRRTIQKGKLMGSDVHRILENVNEKSMAEGLSMNPADELDSKTWTCTTSVSLDVSATCYPIVGTMTAWISSAEQQRRRLQQQQQQQQQQQEEMGSAEDQESVLYHSIQTYIEQNQNAFLSEELLHVAYTGRTNDAPLATNPIQIDIKSNKDVGISAGLIGVIASAVVLAFLAFGFALAYRRRRRGNEEAQSGLDLERGVFPVSAEEDDLDTQDALASQDNKDGDRYNSLFGLSGSRSDDSSVVDNVVISPSSCTTIGAANTAPRQFFPSSPMNSHKDEVAGEQTCNNESYDMAPLSPMNDTTRNEEDDESHNSSADNSSVLEVIDDDSEEMISVPALLSPSDIGNAKMQGSMIV